MVMLTLCSVIQAPIQCVLRPAMWIPGLKELHVHRETWQIGGSSQLFVKRVLEGLKVMREKDDKGSFYDVHKVEENFIRIFAFTWAEWLDIVEIRIKGNVAEAISFSSGLLPLSIPFACVLNVAFCWVPFYGHKFNIRRLENLRTATGATLSAQ